MARIDENRRRGELKRNLALPGESNRRNILGGRGQVQDQASLIVSEKALEQPVVKPGGVLKGRSTVRPEAPIETPGLTTTELFKLGPRGRQDIAGARAGAGIGRTTEPTPMAAEGLSEEDQALATAQGLSAEGQEQLRNIRRRGVKGVPIIRNGELLGFRGTPPKPEGGVKKPKTFSILTGEGIRNIFERSGEIAERLTTPEALARQRRGRGAAAGRKERRASLKQLDTSIKDVASTIGSLNLTAGNEETVNALQTQLDDMIKQRSEVAAGGGGRGRGGPDISTVSGFAVQLRELGLNPEEIRTITQRRFR